jgi:FAD/FMN-containing dehydrogenase
MTHDLSDICRFALDDESLRMYSTDASIFEVKPSKIAFPKNVDELKNLVKAVVEVAEQGQEKITLSPRAGGTCMSGGSLTQGIMVDMKEGFASVGEVDTEKKQIRVESGAYYRDIEKKTLEHGLLFAPYTSSKNICCIGGMVGNNASGEKSIRFGATVDNVVSLKMVCQDGNEYEFGELTEEELNQKKSLAGFEGELYTKLSDLIILNEEVIVSAKPHVRKNAAGYDLWNVWNPEKKTFSVAKLIVGSQGTLGFVTSILLQLVDAPKYTRMVVLPVKSLSHLAEAVKEILNHKPEGLETYDSHTYGLAKVHMPVEAERAKRVDGCDLVLFGQFAEKTEEEINVLARKCVEDLVSKGFEAVYIEDDMEREAHWAIRRASFLLLKDHAPKGFLAVPMIEDTIVPLEKYGEFLVQLEKILEDYKITYTFAGHIGDGSIRLIPLVDYTVAGVTDQIFDLARRVYELTVVFGGSISVDHNDGIIRTPYLSLMFKPEILELFEQTKNIFDTYGIFNPGKKVRGNLEFAKSHLHKI